MIYNLKLNAAQIQLIATALQEAPFKLANPLLTEIQRQVAECEEAQRKIDDAVSAVADKRSKRRTR